MRRFNRLVLPLALLASSVSTHAMAVNVNTADAEALSSALQGVGPAKAHAIVAHREANGPFDSVEELLEVDGIGERTLEQNRDVIELE